MPTAGAAHDSVSVRLVSVLCSSNGAPGGTTGSSTTTTASDDFALRPHSFTVAGVDNVANAGVSTVAFMIVVTPDSIKQDVNLFLAAGLIKNGGMANSLLAKLSSAEHARARGNCSTAAREYDAFIHELQAQAGKGIDVSAATIMTADAQYLVSHCP